MTATDYASRAKNIQNLPVKTLRHSKSSLLSSLITQNQQLQLLLASQRERDGVFLPVLLFQQQQHEHLLLVHQSQEQQRDILSLQRQVDALHAADQQSKHIIDGLNAENERLQQQTKQLQDVLAAMEQEQQQLVQQLKAMQQQKQEFASRLGEKLQQHLSITAIAVSDLRNVLEKARTLDMHRCLLQEREQRTRDSCGGLAGEADAAYAHWQQQLQTLYEQLEAALVSLKKEHATQGEAAAIEETLYLTQQQQLCLQQEQQQRRAGALQLLQLKQQTTRKERIEQLDTLTSSITQFAAECKQARTETAKRGHSALEEVRKKQQHIIDDMQASLQQQLGQGTKASSELQQLLQESSSTHAAEAKQTCMSLRQLAQQVKEWHLQQQRFVEERIAAVAAAMKEQLFQFAQQQRDEVGDHSRRVQQHLQQVQQIILQQREERADQAAAVAAAAAAAGESAATLAVISEVGANNLLEEVENIKVVAAETERDKCTATDGAAACRCQQLQQVIKAVSASEELAGEDLHARVGQVILGDEDALTSAAAAAASNAEAWQQQRRHKQEVTAAATTLLQEASAAADLLHGRCNTALTEQYKLVKKCTTHILTQVLQPHSCVRGQNCVTNKRMQHESEMQRIGDSPSTSSALSYDGWNQKCSTTVDRKAIQEDGENDKKATDLSALCSWCAAAAAAHWLTAPDGYGTAAVARATAGAATAAKDVDAAAASGAEELADISPSVRAAIHDPSGTSAGTGVHAVATIPEAGWSGLAGGSVLTDDNGRPSPSACHSALHEMRKAQEQQHRLEEAAETAEIRTTLLHEQVPGVGSDETVHGAPAQSLLKDSVGPLCECSRNSCPLPEAGGETSLTVRLAAAPRGIHTDRSSSGEDAAGSTKRSHGTTPHSKTGSSSSSSNEFTGRSLPSRSTTTTSTPCCSSSASRESSSRREEHPGKKFQVLRRERAKRSPSRPSQSPSQTFSEPEDGGNALAAQPQSHEQHKTQEESGDVRKAEPCAAPLQNSFRMRKKAPPLHKRRQQHQRSVQVHRQQTKLDKQLHQHGASCMRQPLIKLLSFGKKRVIDEDISTNKQEQYAQAEVQQQRQHHGRYQARERTPQAVRSSQAQMHHHQQPENPPVQIASLGSAGKNTLLSNGSSGLSSLEELNESLSHPAPQPGLRRSRSGENFTHTEADKRKKVHDEAQGDTECESHFPILPAA